MLNEEREEQAEQNGVPASEEQPEEKGEPRKENEEQSFKSPSEEKGEEQSPGSQPEEKNELAEGYLAQLKRTQADLENLQKRTEAEKARIIESANESLVSGLLETLDNFERALVAMKENASADFEGVRKVYEGFVKTLEEDGLERICTEGCQFDPYKHEAVMQSEVEASEDGRILEEFQTGYMFKSKVIRPSKVKVARYVKNDVKDENSSIEEE